MADITVKVIKKENKKIYQMTEPSFEVLLRDASLEEIMINGPNIPVHVYHRDYGMCETNLEMTEREIMNFIKDVSTQTGDYLNAGKPFLDARLPDGSRLNATIPPATPEGATITIRKFRENPLSIVDLINYNTMSIDLAAILWMFIEGMKNYPLNVLVIGGTGSGKTTTLNVLAGLIPNEDRIITVEDTLELNFYGRKNVIRMESKPGTENLKPITMNDLLINALRMRPDRLIMGEVRGPEAESLFNAMNVGHSAMGTLHANSPNECISRLTNPPMNVPRDMLPLMDLIVVQNKIRTPHGLRRRVTGVVEVVKSEVGISFSELFSYDPKKDEIYRTDIPSQKMEELAKLAGLTLSQINKNVEEKKELIRSMVQEGLHTFRQVINRVQDYYEEGDV